MMNKDNMDKKYILVAEDDKFYAGVYRRKLTAEGYEVEVVENGQKAIESVKKRKPDLLLLDLIMPVMDGFSTLGELRKDDDSKDMQIVVMSNLGQDEDIKKAKDLGANDYFVKSNYSLQEIIEKIKNYLQ